MNRYIDKSGGNGITHYERTIGGIKVRYTNGKEYHYTDQSAGVRIVQRMQQLAESGKGLTSFIRDNKPGHAKQRA